MLEARNLFWPDMAAPRLRDVSVSLLRGQLHAVLGPNGAGKSTLLRLLAGEISPADGHVVLEGRSLKSWPAAELARRRAVLPQRHALAFGFTAAQVVALGRTPCVQGSRNSEAALVAGALQAAGAQELADRRYTSLSGGEQARVHIARVFAQLADTDRGVLLLDEPTAALDLAHQQFVLRALRAQAARGLAVLLVTHDPALALRHADRATLLAGGERVASGPVKEALTSETLSRAFGARVQVRPPTPDAAVAVTVED